MCVYVCVYIFDFPYVYIIMTGMDPSMMAGMMNNPMIQVCVCIYLRIYTHVCVGMMNNPMIQVCI